MYYSGAATVRLQRREHKTGSGTPEVPPPAEDRKHSMSGTDDSKGMCTRYKVGSGTPKHYNP
eukprot:8461614-Pyramimonas_sp.AAC.1